LNDCFTRDGVGASQVHCPEGEWATVHAFLCERFTFVNAQEWALRFESRSILNAAGEPITLEAQYAAKQVVFYFRTIANEPHLPYEETVLYQDDSLVVADKPHFLPVIPSGQYVQETLLVRLKRKLNLPNLVPLHRIDRDTAGVVLFAVQPSQRAAYHALFRDGNITKTYHALAPYSETLATRQLPFSVMNRLETAANFMQMEQVDGVPNTHTDVLSMQRLNPNSKLARYTLQPRTGKRHQLRVHMLGLGVPILGDGIYPEFLPERDIAVIGHAPLQLLAQSIQFTDPISKELRCFESQRSLSLQDV
jgi:tRNA pseudouridine32 synthase / 23S rRNA pseudouridine746 synthase